MSFTLYLSSDIRKPLQSCCKNILLECVTLAKVTIFTAGTSIPSFNISIDIRIDTVPIRKFDSALNRSVISKSLCKSEAGKSNFLK